jgi:hypothetical protein
MKKNLFLEANIGSATEEIPRIFFCKTGVSLPCSWSNYSQLIDSKILVSMAISQL